MDVMNPNLTPFHGSGAKRKGKWSSEEEEFANKLILLFHSGLLNDVKSGATLRTYLSEKLQCDPMRITKKFSGESSIGKQLFQLFNDEDHDYVASETEINELQILQKEFLNKMAYKNKLNNQSQNNYTDRKNVINENNRSLITRPQKIRRINSANFASGDYNAMTVTRHGATDNYGIKQNRWALNDVGNIDADDRVAGELLYNFSKSKYSTTDCDITTGDEKLKSIQERHKLITASILSQVH